MNYVKKRNGKVEEFSKSKIENALKIIFKKAKRKSPVQDAKEMVDVIVDKLNLQDGERIKIEDIQDVIQSVLIENNYAESARIFILYREKRKVIRDQVREKERFIEKYKGSANTANATVDDNSNVRGKNVGILNAEIHKEDNIQISRGMIMRKLREMYKDFDAKNYVRDLENHVIYKHDESSFAGAIAPYCVSVSMYPFLTDGLKNLGGLSAAPKNLDSYCGMYSNLIFAISAQYAGAVATSEFLLYFDYFARKEWGDEYYKHCDDITRQSLNPKTIKQQIHQYFQQVVYSINQPAGSRGSQCPFTNFSYFDKPFFEGMFGNFVFPDGSAPIWDSLCWLQKDFMMWFNEERLKTMLTFPVESFALVHKDGKFIDQESADFVSEEYAHGHSFFTYISDTVDSLSSCCRLKNMVQTKEFNFTNGNMGLQTGSKSVITLNLNRIVQDWSRKNGELKVPYFDEYTWVSLKNYIGEILERVYKYHSAYNELLHGMNDAGLLTAYRAGFINLNKQYLTIGLNGLNEAAEYLGVQCSDNEYYSKLCQNIFSFIKEQNIAHKTKKLTFNTEQVPAESLAIKNYNWDKADGYWVPEDRNLYASYIYKPSDDSLSIAEKIRMHGSNYIGEYLDGGAAAHLNLESHLGKEQYKNVLEYAASNGCSYLTFNIPNTECEDCGFISKSPLHVCPKCGSKNVSWYDRIVGYLTKISNWSSGRQQEQATRFYGNNDNVGL